MSWYSTSTATNNYMYIYTSDGTIDSSNTVTWRIPTPNIPWPKEKPEILMSQSERFIDLEHRLRAEFDQKLQTAMQQMTEQVLKVVALMPRNGHRMKYRKGVWCGNCGNFIPEGKEKEKCEYCGK